MLGTLQCPSFGSSGPSSAKAARTISSTLDDLQLDIMLQIHERIYEFFSPWHYPLLLRNRCIRWKGRRRGSGSEAGEGVGRELSSPSLFKEGAQQLRKGERLGQKLSAFPYSMQMRNQC